MEDRRIKFRFRVQVMHPVLYFYDTSTSNTRVAPPGILGGLPVEPYAYSDLIVKTDNSPRVIEATPRSHPASTTYDQKKLGLNYNITISFIIISIKITGLQHLSN